MSNRPLVLSPQIVTVLELVTFVCNAEGWAARKIGYALVKYVAGDLSQFTFMAMG